MAATNEQYEAGQDDQERTQQEAETQDGLQDRALGEAGQESPMEEAGDTACECKDQLDQPAGEVASEADAVVEPASPAEGKGPAEEADAGPEESRDATSAEGKDPAETTNIGEGQSAFAPDSQL